MQCTDCADHVHIIAHFVAKAKYLVGSLKYNWHNAVHMFTNVCTNKIKEFGDESATSSNNPDPPRSTNSTGSELNAKQRKPTNWKENQLLLGKPTGRKTFVKP